MIPLIALMLATTCPSPESGLPASLADWSNARSETASTVGRSVKLSLLPATALLVTPGKTPKPNTNAAVASFIITKAGTYEVALSEAAWIDVVKSGAAVVSTTHRHGPECTSIRKIVAFKLEAGRYALQISGSAKPVATVAIYPAGL